MLSILPKKVSSNKRWIILLLAFISFIGINGFAPEYPHYKEFNINKSDISHRYTDVFLDIAQLNDCCTPEKNKADAAEGELEKAETNLDAFQMRLDSCEKQGDCDHWRELVVEWSGIVNLNQKLYDQAKAAYDRCKVEHLPITIYIDEDQDGLGDKTKSRPGCSGRPLSKGLSLNNEDCDDTNADIRRCGRCCTYLANGKVDCGWKRTDAECKAAAAGSGENAEAVFSDQTHCKMEDCPPRKASFLPSLNAYYDKDAPNVKIQWETPDQSEATNFFIQRSRDGKRFKTIGIQKNTNATSGESLHIFSDINPLDIGYYRITWASQGKLYSSQGVPVYAGSESNMQLSPNPTNGFLRIFLRDKGLNEIEISVFDATGHVVISKRMMSNENELDVSGLIKGFYIIQATQGHKVYREKFYKE